MNDKFKDFLNEALKQSNVVPGAQSKEFLHGKRSNRIFKELDDSITNYFNNIIEAHKLQKEILDDNITSFKKSRLGKEDLKNLSDEAVKNEKILTFLNKKKYTFEQKVKGKAAKDVIQAVFDISNIDRIMQKEQDAADEAIKKAEQDAKTSQTASNTNAPISTPSTSSSPAVVAPPSVPIDVTSNAPSYDYKAPGQVAASTEPSNSTTATTSSEPPKYNDYSPSGTVAANATPATDIPKSEITPEIPEIKPEVISNEPKKDVGPTSFDVEPAKSTEINPTPETTPATTPVTEPPVAEHKDITKIKDDVQFQDEISKLIDSFKKLGESITPTLLAEEKITELLNDENIDKIRKSNLSKSQFNKLANGIKKIIQKNGYNLANKIGWGDIKPVSVTPVAPPTETAPTPTPEPIAKEEPPKLSPEIPDTVIPPKETTTVTPPPITDNKLDDTTKEKVFSNKAFLDKIIPQYEKYITNLNSYNKKDVLGNFKSDEKRKPFLDAVTQSKNSINIIKNDIPELKNIPIEDVLKLSADYKAKVPA